MPWGWAAAAAAVGSIGSAAIAASSVPDAPDYTAVAEGSTRAAEIQSQVSREQLDWAKQQYADQAPRTEAYFRQMLSASEMQQDNAGEDRERYESIYQPIEEGFAATAQRWNTPARADQEAGAAKADVAASVEAARRTALATLEGYGIDPSQTRFQALDVGTRVQQAATQAAAGTQARRNVEATELALQGEAINVGKGYPGQVAQSYSGATQAGGAGVTAALNTSQTYGNLMGSPTQWGALATNSRAGAVQAINTGFGNEMVAHNAEMAIAANTSRGIGQIVGAGMQARMMGAI